MILEASGIRNPPRRSETRDHSESSATIIFPEIENSRNQQHSVVDKDVIFNSDGYVTKSRKSISISLKQYRL